MPDQLPTRWEPRRASRAAPVPPGGPPAAMPLALWRGLRCRCPGCGKTDLFAGFLKVGPACAVCRTPIDLAAADDAPPYFTIFIVAHLIVPAMLYVDLSYDLPFWMQAVIWLPATGMLAVGLLRPVKGATVALMLKLNILADADAA